MDESVASISIKYKKVSVIYIFFYCCSQGWVQKVHGRQVVTTKWTYRLRSRTLQLQHQKKSFKELTDTSVFQLGTHYIHCKGILGYKFKY